MHVPYGYMRSHGACNKKRGLALTLDDRIYEVVQVRNIMLKSEGVTLLRITQVSV